MQFLISMSNCRQPLTTTEGLQLVNSLIKGTKYERMVTKFQSKYCKGTMKKTTKKGELGTQFWHNFMKCNSHCLINKWGEKFASSRADWLTYDNFERMYNDIYAAMKKAGLICDLETPVSMDSQGNIVPMGDSTAFGLPVWQCVIHPDHLIFMDEMGLNTNQKTDRHVGGECFVCAHGATPKIGISTTDHLCTIIPIVAASGEAVCCVVIFTGDSESLPVDWCIGRDI